MTHKTFTIAGIKVRTQSNCRFVAWQVVRVFDGVQYDPYRAAAVSIFKRSNNLETLKRTVQRQGFHSSRHYVITDAFTGEEAR